MTVLTRREEHAAALREQGLRVSGRSDFTARLDATADPAALPADAELAILACKSTDLEPLAARLEGTLPGATVMTIQNGLGAEEIVAAHGEWPLLSAVTFMSGTRHGDAHVEYVLDTATWIGPYRGTTEDDARRVAELIEAGGLKAEAFPDLRPAQWSKLIFNATVNGVAALTGLPHDFHFAQTEELSDLGHLVRDLVDEGKAVAAAAGVELHDDPWEMNVLATQRGHRHFPSMLEDVEARRPTELELINGALVREAQSSACRCPSRRRSIGSSRRGRRATRSEDCGRGVWGGGSLFAANLSLLDDVEVWAFDLNELHVAAINRDGLRLSGAGDVVGRPRATSDAAELPPCDFGIVATKAMHTEPAIAATAHAFADGCVATVQNGLGNEETIAGHVERVIRGTTFPAGKLLEPGHVQWDVKGDTRSARTTSGRRSPRSSGSPTPARGPGCRRRRSRTRAGRSGARSSSTRPRTRSARSPASPTAASASGPTCARSSPAWSTRGRPSPRRRASSSTPTPRS